MTVPVLAGLDTSAGLCWGLDVSQHNAPASIDWARASELGCRYGIVRLTNGVDFDSAAKEHCKRIRGAGVALGGYGFFIPWHEPERLVSAFTAASEMVGYGHAGDVAPWLDVESWPGASGYHKANPEWSEPASRTMWLMQRRFGVATLYINVSDWNAMGSPDWIGRYPLAAAHYTAKTKPLTAGNLTPAFWQRTVAPIAGVSARPIDQSVAQLPLVTIPHPEAHHQPPQVQRVEVGWIPSEWDRAAHDRARNAAAGRIE